MNRQSLHLANVHRRAPCASMRIRAIGWMAGTGIDQAVLQHLK